MVSLRPSSPPTALPSEGASMDFLFFFLGLAATIAALCHIKKTSE